jgi:hypothetical protein
VRKAVLRRRTKYLRCTLLSQKKEGRRYDPEEKSDDSPPVDLSALSSVGVDRMRTIQHIPDVLALLSGSLKYKAGSVLA